MPHILGLHPIDIIVIIAYFAVVLYIGYRAMKKVKNSEDYFLGGRQFGKFFQTFSQFGQATSTESAVQSVSMVGANGLAAAFSSMVQGILKGPLAWLFPKWLRRSRLMSMADFFVERLQSKKLAAVYALAIAFLFILVGAAGLYAMSKTVCVIAEKPVTELTQSEKIEYNQSKELESLESQPVELLTKNEKTQMDNLRKINPRQHFSYFNSKMLIIFMAIFILLYAAGGGLEAAVYTDAMQSIFILILTVILIPFAMIKLNAMHGTEGIIGPFQAIHSILPQSMFDIFGSPKWVEFKWYNIVLLALMGIAGNLALANNLVVSGSAKTEKVASFGGMTGIMIRSISSLFWMVLALFILGLFGESVSDPDMLWGLSARTLLPTGLLGLMMACLLAALMSTADTHMMTVSGLLTQNIYKPLRPNRPDKHYVTMGRILGIVYITGAVILAFNASNVFRMMKFMIFIMVACGPAILMGFIWRRTNTKAAWVSMGLSLLFALVIPLFASFSFVRESPKLHQEIQSSAVVKVYTASERDIVARTKEIVKWKKLKAKDLVKSECPKPLKSGDKFSKTYLPAPRALFWDQNIKQTKDGVSYGDGLFKPELYLLYACGVNLQKYTPSQVEAFSILFRLIFPFLAIFVVSMMTKPIDKKVLDDFYVKLRTPVNEDHDQDAIDVAENQKHPERTEAILLFPGSNWEFQKQPRYDIIGMSVAFVGGIILTLTILWIAFIGT